MSARRVWIAECDVCATTREFDGHLSVDELGDAVVNLDWELPRYGGMLCPRCSKAVKALNDWGK